MLDNFKNKLGDMGDIMAKAKKLKESLGETKKELAKKIIETSYKKRIRIKITGEMSIQEIKINPAYYEETTLKKLEDDILKACNQALDESKKEANKLLSKVTGGLNIPGM